MTKASPERVTRIRTNPKPKVAKGRVRQSPHPAEDAPLCAIPPPPDMPLSWRWFSRAAALALLAFNSKRQRPRDPAHVEELAREFDLGRLQPSNDMIVIGADGTLFNGQHRLQALADSGLAGAYFPVMENASDAVFDAIDWLRKPRSLSFILETTNSILSEARFIFAMKMGQRRQPPAHDAKEILGWWSPAMEAIAARVPRRIGSRNTAPIRVAVGLRWALSTSAAERETLLERLAQFVDDDRTFELPASLHALRDACNKSPPKNHGAAAARCAHAFMCFDAANFARSVPTSEARPLVVKDYLNAMPAAKAAAKNAPGHPYVFAPASQRAA